MEISKSCTELNLKFVSNTTTILSKIFQSIELPLYINDILEFTERRCSDATNIKIVKNCEISANFEERLQ